MSPSNFYLVFLLRIWQEQDQAAKDPDPVRITLEDPHNGSVQSFASLSEMFAYFEKVIPMRKTVSELKRK